MLANLFCLYFFGTLKNTSISFDFHNFFPLFFTFFFHLIFTQILQFLPEIVFFFKFFPDLFNSPNFFLNFFTFSFSWKRYFLVRNPMTRIPNWSLNWSSNWSWKSLTTNRKLVRNWISDRCDQQQLLTPVALFSALGT